MNAWLNGRRTAMALRKEKIKDLTLVGRVSEEGDDWDAARIKHELLAILKETGVQPAYLISAWDTELKDRRISKREFLVHISKKSPHPIEAVPSATPVRAPAISARLRQRPPYEGLPAGSHSADMLSRRPAVQSG